MGPGWLGAETAAAAAAASTSFHSSRRCKLTPTPAAAIEPRSATVPQRARVVYRRRGWVGTPPSEAAARPPTTDHDAGRIQVGGAAAEGPAASSSGAERSSGSASDGLRLRAAGSAGKTLRATWLGIGLGLWSSGQGQGQGQGQG